MQPGRLRHLAAVTSLVALACAATAPATRAETFASWGGRVFHADRGAPRGGVVVSLKSATQGQPVHLRSEPTRDDGAFSFEGAPAGTYAVSVEAPEGVFAAAEPLELQPGANPALALSLGALTPHAKQEHGIGDAEVSRTTELIIAGSVTLAALLIFLEITDDDDETSASVF